MSDKRTYTGCSDTITKYEPGKFYKGYTLFCYGYKDPQVGMGRMVLIRLIDMEGNIAHKWTARTATHAQLTELSPDGNLYYTTQDRSDITQAGLYKIDPESKMIWRFRCRIDHDFHLMDNGHIMIHCIMDKMAPNIGPELKRCPYIVEITPDKKVLWEWHGEKHTDELSRLCGMRFPINWEIRTKQEVDEKKRWDERIQVQGIEECFNRLKNLYSFDWAHNNTCEVLPDNPTAKKDSRFKKGNILFSYRVLDIIGIIDKDTGAIVWAWGPGNLDGQHQPTMLANGNILIFDNGARRGWSRVIELDPLREEIVWEYMGKPKDSFFSRGISGAQLLPNGNIFICEGSRRRLFEVTRDKEIVWEYKSPYRERRNFGFYRATRYSPEFVSPLLNLNLANSFEK